MILQELCEGVQPSAAFPLPSWGGSSVACMAEGLSMGGNNNDTLPAEPLISQQTSEGVRLVRHIPAAQPRAALCC